MNNKSIFKASFDRSRGGSIHAEGNPADAIGYAIAAVVIIVGSVYAYAISRKKTTS